MGILKSLFCLSVLLLAACGGSEEVTPEKSDNLWLQLTPSSLSFSTYEGDSLSFTINAKALKTISQNFNVGVVDKAGVLQPSVKLDRINQMEYMATLTTSGSLVAGTYSSNLEVRLCEDDPLICSKPISGSPWRVPLSLTVKAGTNLKPLAVVSGLQTWSNYQGNAAHNAYIPAIFEVSNFSRRWVLLQNSLTASYWQGSAGAVVENGQIFIVKVYGNDGWVLQAINEATGKENWRSKLGLIGSASPPAVANGKVYVTSVGSPSALFIFDQQSGALLSKQDIPDQGGHYWVAPSLFTDGVYIINGGMNSWAGKFNSSAATAQWSARLGQFNSIAMAVDSQYTYSISGNVLFALNTNDGSFAFNIKDSNYEWGSKIGTPVLAANGMIFNTQTAGNKKGRLLAFDLAKLEIKWQFPDAFSSEPVVVDNVLYVMNGKNLEVRNAIDGMLKFVSVMPDDASSYDKLLISKNLAFVSSSNQTLVVDLKTQKVVWQYPYGGDLAISDKGVLYINDAKHNLIAINLN